jgi:hypothetical protein
MLKYVFIVLIFLWCILFGFSQEIAATVTLDQFSISIPVENEKKGNGFI